MEDKKTTFVFYTEWLKYIDILDTSDIKELLSIICDYVENLKEPKKPNLSDRLLMTWLFIKNQLDKDKTKYDKRCETSKINGKKGGRPKNLKNLKKPKKADNDNEYDNEYEYVNDNDITTTSSNNKKENKKEKYGEFENVLLTEEEYHKLDKANLLSYIDTLSNYIASKGKRYKSHYATILNWSRRDGVSSNVQLADRLIQDIQIQEASDEDIRKLEERMRRVKNEN